ncbi:spore cortex-lytic enzyme [Paenibacillus sp. 28ISP30-2]|nr:spore cortex-lytic enzyme [Paenibacillus sp. 28ISP30-2]
MKKTMVWICTGILAASAITYTGLIANVSAQHAEPLSTQQEVQVTETEPSQATFSTEAVNYGSYSQDVYELQSRLKLLGFFGAEVDSHFGSSTLKAVKGFQKEFGITPDGVVGAKTKLKLVNATPNWKPTETPLHRKNEGPAQGQTADNNKPDQKDETMGSANTMGLSDNDLKIMANAVYGESRGEPFEGQVAVAAVILNRVKSPSFPNTPSGVIFQPGAFTAVADGQIWFTPNESSPKAVRQALNGWDPSGGCLYYFNPKTATSKWIWSRPQVKTIGQHIFCM